MMVIMMSRRAAALQVRVAWVVNIWRVLRVLLICGVCCACVANMLGGGGRFRMQRSWVSLSSITKSSNASCFWKRSRSKSSRKRWMTKMRNSKITVREFKSPKALSAAFQRKAVGCANAVLGMWLWLCLRPYSLCLSALYLSAIY